MKDAKRDFNGVAKFLLGLSMFATMMTIINTIQAINNYSFLGIQNYYPFVVEVIIDTLIIIAAVITFMKKRYGLITLIVLFIIRMFATINWSGNISIEGQLGSKAAYFVRDFGLFAIAMFFRKDGISGWKAMLASDKIVEANAVMKGNEEAPLDEFLDKNVILKSNNGVVPTGIPEYIIKDDVPLEPSLSTIIATESRESKEAVFEGEKFSSIPHYSPRTKETKRIKSRKYHSIIRRTTPIPLWVILLGLVVIVTLSILLILSKNSDSSKLSEREKQPRESFALEHLDVSDEVLISEEDLERNRDNIAKIYSIMKEEYNEDIGNNVDEFASMMSLITNRKKIYDVLYEDYEMGTFEEFDERFYPATKEHLVKEKDRRWFYQKLKENGVVVGSYETFCTLLCYDEELRNFYNQGIQIGLDLGSYEDCKRALR